jgi:K+-transporting ATPase KdpF subunit
VSWDNAVALALSIGVLVYLVYALLAPEKLG